MNAKVIFAFVLGAAVGVAASWKFAQRKWEAYAEEDIKSVKEAYGRKLDENRQNNPEKEKEELSKVVTDLGYTSSAPINPNIVQRPKTVDHKPTVNYNEIADATKRELNDIPYVIRNDLFGSEDYTQINLRYDINNLDGVRSLYDEISQKEENELKTLGENVIEYIDNNAEFEPSDDGQEESCIVHVRDDILKIDYEIDVHRW